MTDTQVAVGTPVRWSAIGGQHEGTVTAGPDRDGYYTITTANHATATLKRDRFEIAAEQRVADAEPELTSEQRAALVTDRAEQLARRQVTDAIMQVYTLIREDTQRDLGVTVEGDVADDMRIEAAVRVHNAAVELRERLTAQIAEKRKQPPPATSPEPAAIAAPPTLP